MDSSSPVAAKPQLFNNGAHVNPQLRKKATEMQSFMDTITRGGGTEQELYNHAKASLPILQNEYKRLELCSVNIAKDKNNRQQNKELLLTKISAANPNQQKQLTLTNEKTDEKTYHF